MISLATIISDSLTFLVLAISAAVLKFGHVQPYQRGFYCYARLRITTKDLTLNMSDFYPIDSAKEGIHLLLLLPITLLIVLSLL